MPRYRVYLTNVVSTMREVEAPDDDAAQDEVLTEGFPGLMFLDHSYPDEGDWEVAGVDEVPA